VSVTELEPAEAPELRFRRIEKGAATDRDARGERGHLVDLLALPGRLDVVAGAGCRDRPPAR
jgi:hypothetical protein